MLKEKSKIDFYTQKAKEEGYPARSVYKLQEINGKYRLFKKGDKVLDLGCAPGSWLSYISREVGQSGKVLGIDIADIKIPPEKNTAFLKADVLKLRDFGPKKYNAVVSDLAPKTSGVKSADAGKSLELCEKAFEIARKVLMPGGNFLCKIFIGESSDDFFNKIEKKFKFAKRFKPMASRKESREIFIIGKFFVLH